MGTSVHHRAVMHCPAKVQRKWLKTFSCQELLTQPRRSLSADLCKSPRWHDPTSLAASGHVWELTQPRNQFFARLCTWTNEWLVLHSFKSLIYYKTWKFIALYRLYPIPLHWSFGQMWSCHRVAVPWKCVAYLTLSEFSRSGVAQSHQPDAWLCGILNHKVRSSYILLGSFSMSTESSCIIFQLPFPFHDVCVFSWGGFHIWRPQNVWIS